MIAIVWEFTVKPDALERFRSTYGPHGQWAVLFGLHPGFRGTTLLEDTRVPGRFVTIDAWVSAADFDGLRRAQGEEYARLDRACEEMTVTERELGVFRLHGTLPPLG